MAVSDIALKKPLPPEIENDLLAYVGCIAGAILIEDYVAGLKAAGFADVEVIDTKKDLNAYAQVEGQSGARAGCAALAAPARVGPPSSGCCDGSSPRRACCSPGVAGERRASAALADAAEQEVTT